MKNKLLQIFIALATALALSACGGPAEPEQTLEERVMARWQHMIERDFAAAWEYYSPGFRQTSEQSAFVRDIERRPIRWHEVELRDITCPEQDLCNIRVEVVYQASGGPSEFRDMQLSRFLEERWVRIGGQWWFSAN